MSKQKRLSDIEIANKLRQKRAFTVHRPTDRKRVLTAANYLDILISTRANTNGGFDIYFLNA